MIDNDINKLNQQEPRRPLDGLEADIWAGVEARLREQRFSKTVVLCQVAVLAVGLLTSAAAGTQLASAQNQPSAFDVFSMRADLAPSSRLIGP